ncbi:MAG: hypothetical protein FWB98_01375 [Defluviitaleaceae bacterium]|nr:hypothetical protein [Defluviitaleaceae bacterium]
MKFAETDFYRWAIDNELEDVARSILRIKMMIVCRHACPNKSSNYKSCLSAILELEKKVKAAQLVVQDAEK